MRRLIVSPFCSTLCPCRCYRLGVFLRPVGWWELNRRGPRSIDQCFEGETTGIRAPRGVGRAAGKWCVRWWWLVAVVEVTTIRLNPKSKKSEHRGGRPENAPNLAGNGPRRILHGHGPGQPGKPVRLASESPSAITVINGAA